MSRARSTPLIVAVLGLLALAGAVAAFAAQQPAVRRAGRAATHPPCPPPAPGAHHVVVLRGRPALLLVVPPGPATHRRPVLLVRPQPGLTAQALAGATHWGGFAHRRGALVAYFGAGTGDAAYVHAAVSALTGNMGCGDAARTEWVAGPAPATATGRSPGYRPPGRRATR